MRAFIGLGSNLEYPIGQIKKALKNLRSISDTEVITQSSLYESTPIGPRDQPNYINAVAELDTQLSPHILLDNIQLIEKQHGRIRKRQWGERTLDLDILVYGELILNDRRLTIPHPEIAIRTFVIYPLSELTTQLDIPGLGKVGQLVRNYSSNQTQQVTNIDL